MLAGVWQVCCSQLSASDLSALHLVTVTVHACTTPAKHSTRHFPCCFKDCALGGVWSGEFLQGCDMPLSWPNPVLMFCYSLSEKVASYIKIEFLSVQFMSIAPSPVTGYHWGEPGSVFCIPFIRCIHIDAIPCRLKSPSSLSLYFYVRNSKPLIVFMAFGWACSSASISLVPGSSELDTALQRGFIRTEKRGRITSCRKTSSSCNPNNPHQSSPHFSSAIIYLKQGD